ncbi:MAG: VCBS repeat-containing protein [Bacteroidota bacterium]|nr:VCBS repeat-containing protein [Bacteroidota bacterium]
MRTSHFLRTLLSLFLGGCFSCSQPATENQAPADNTPHLFSLLGPEQTNINFQNTLTEGLNTNILMYEYFYNGGGVAAGDFNNDGLTDLYFTSNMGDNALYLNKGNLQFEDITAICGAAGRSGPWKTGVSVADVNGDGRLDIYLCYSGALPPEKRVNELYINKGNNSRGTPMFEERAAAFGLNNAAFSNQAYFFDYDRDGDLDMLLLNHNPKNLPILNEKGTAEMMAKDSPEKGLRLFKQTKGHFDDVTTVSGINGSELSYGLGLGIADFNEDGWPDFYVSNDYAVPDYLYINNKNGTFSNKLSDYVRHTSQFSMGNDVSDINNDGRTDIFTLDMLPEDNHRQKLLLAPDNYAKFDVNVRSGFYYQYMRNMLQLNNANGSFSEIGQLAGISNTDWSWSALFADYDNDGWKDLYVTNGYRRDYTNLDFINYMNEYVAKKGRLQRDDVMKIIDEMPASNIVNYVFRNKHGNTFENKQADWGITKVSNSNGALYADLDNDGDLDLVTNNINQPAFVYRNNAREQNKQHYLSVNLKGDSGNTQGIGAHLTLFTNGMQQTLDQNPARGYLSTVSYTLHFGLGEQTSADSLFITWNSGKMQKLYQLRVDTTLMLEEKMATAAKPASIPQHPLFNKTAAPISYQPAPQVINDFDRQPLLISEFSWQGPVIRKADINKDGREDILVGGQQGQALAVYVQSANGGFTQKKWPVFEKDKACTIADIAVFDANGDGYPDIYLASGGYHNLNENDSLLQDHLYLNDGNNNFLNGTGIPVTAASSKSCVRVQDINGDGHPDLFVGGRVVPGRYPEPPRSFILINDGKGHFSDQTKQICAALEKPGMITDARWVDLDGDGKNELVTAGEWMPLQAWKYTARQLKDVSNQFFDAVYSGWWNTIETGDFNGDGKPDIVAGNFGLNTQFHPTVKEPMDMYYADFDKNGSVDPIFSFYIQGKAWPYVTRDELVTQLPVLRKRFSDFKSYADIGTNDLFPEDVLKGAGHLQAAYTASCILLNKAGGKFSMTALPEQAQYAPVYVLQPLDYNHDGKTDLLVCGNNNHTKIRLGRFDANYGVLLTGDGNGGFTYVPQPVSGFDLRGEVRACVPVGDKWVFGINGQPLSAWSPTLHPH